jgi:hypothetical protein
MRRKKIIALIFAVITPILTESGHAQNVDRHPGTIMRTLMPTGTRCENVTWEPMSYCRYMAANAPGVIFELSFSPDGAGGSLTYDPASLEARQFFGAMRLYFLKLGTPASAFDDCVARSQLDAVEIPVGDWILKCRFSDFGEKLAYEIYSERPIQFSPVVSFDAAHLRPHSR